MNHYEQYREAVRKLEAEYRASLEAQHNRELRSAIVDALVAKEAIGIAYVAENGIMSVRDIVPLSIERAANGQIIVRAYDPQRKGPRTFRLDRIMAASNN